MVGGAYEGADRHDRELAMWSPSFGSADMDLLPEKEMLDARSRDLIQNDAFMRGGAEIHKDSIVGAMFTLNSKPAFNVLGLDEVWAEEFQEEVESKFTLWAESPSNWVDASRRMNLTALVRLCVGLELMTGEVLFSCEWVQDRDRPFKTAIQMIDTDRLQTPPHVFTNGRNRGGVQRDFRGRAIGYWIRRQHPSDWVLPVGSPNAFRYVRAEKPWGRKQIVHLFEQMRPDQSRGVAAMTAALKEAKISRQFRGVMLQNAIVNATYAATIESDMDPAKVFEALGGGAKGGDDWAGMVQKYGNGFLGAVADYQKKAKNATLNGVRIPHLFPGTKLNLNSPSQGGPLGTDFEKSLLRYLAANFGISYEQMSKDFSQASYSALRGAINETQKHMQARKKAIADTVATHIYMLWLEEAIASGEISAMPRRAPGFWDGLNKEAYSNCSWIGASRGQIEELKETQAAVLRIKYGLSTREDELARLGKDWRPVFRQLKREQTEAEDMGLSFVEDDKMMNASTGAPREKDAADEQDKDE